MDDSLGIMDLVYGMMVKRDDKGEIQLRKIAWVLMLLAVMLCLSVLYLFNFQSYVNHGENENNEDTHAQESLDYVKQETYLYDNVLELNQKEVGKEIGDFHNRIDTTIHMLHQYLFDTDGKPMRNQRAMVLDRVPQMVWIEENFDFKNARAQKLVSDINANMESYANGDTDSLFEVKKLIYELDREVNPDTYDRERAMSLSLEAAEKIKNREY